ncbi:MAG: cytochrome c oxidase assembly protein [Methylocystis sp.]|nr:cytochrome c oxidase assembly protein [Methylocystis sp.]
MSSDVTQKQRRGRRKAATFAVFGAAAMLALSFASAPLYRMFCAATGFGGKTQVAKVAPARMGDRTLTVRFDANVARDLPWRFEPEVAKLTLRTGQTATVIYKVANLSDHETRGVAAYNVSPEQAGAYFDKLVCFCFQEQKLAARESAEWPVVFFLDPALESDAMMRRVEEVTLSYSFFAAKSAPPAASAAPTRTMSEAAEKPKS